MNDIGQGPVVVKRELDGFILNRLQGAMLSEALRLVGEGYVSPQDLDRTVQDGLGLRWSFIGPFATIELNAPGGVADYCARYGAFYRSLAERPPTPAVWDSENVQRVSSQLDPPTTSSERDARMRWRDLRLLSLRRHKRDEPDSN
jgi:3-hydroxyacyl-CoA dehydrogenase